MTQTKSFSVSAIKAAELCPRKYYHQKVAKTYPDTFTAAGQWGRDVHEAFEARLRADIPLPANMQQFELLLRRLASAPEKHTELKLAVSPQFEPCPWPEQWYDWKRIGGVCIIDLFMPMGNDGILIDYKTGRWDDDEFQLQLGAWMAMTHFQNIERIKASYIWLRTMTLSKQVIYHRAEMMALWNDINIRIERFKNLFIQGEFPARPNFLCRKHCPVKECEYHGGRS